MGKRHAGLRRRAGARGSYALLMGATFLLYALNNVETSAMPTYVMDRGGSALLASAQTSLFVLAAVLLRLVLGPMSDRRGPRFVMLVGAAGFAVPCALLPLCGELWQVVALRACQAVGLAAFHPCVSLAVSRMSAPEHVGGRLGAARFVATLSLMVGPAALFPLIDAAGYGAFFGVLCAMGLAGFALLVPLDDGCDEHGEACGGGAGPDGDGISAEGTAGTRATGTPGVSPQELFCQHAALLAFPFACALGYGAALNFGKALAAEALPGMNDGLLFTFVSVGGLAGSLACGRLADRMGARVTVAGSLGLAAAGSLVLAFARVSAPFAAGGVLFGLGYFGATTALTAALARSAGDAAKGSALALQQSCLDLGLAAGSLLAGVAVQASGSATSAFFAAAVLIGLCVPAWLAASRGSSRTPVPMRPSGK